MSYEEHFACSAPQGPYSLGPMLVGGRQLVAWAHWIRMTSDHSVHRCPPVSTEPSASQEGGTLVPLSQARKPLCCPPLGIASSISAWNTELLRGPGGTTRTFIRRSLRVGFDWNRLFSWGGQVWSARHYCIDIVCVNFNEWVTRTFGALKHPKTCWYSSVQGNHLRTTSENEAFTLQFEQFATKIPSFQETPSLQCGNTNKRSTRLGLVWIPLCKQSLRMVRSWSYHIPSIHDSSITAGYTHMFSHHQPGLDRCYQSFITINHDKPVLAMVNHFVNHY